MSYATVQDGKNALGATTSTDNARMLTNLNTVTRRMLGMAAFGFEPELKTVHYEVLRDCVDSNRRTLRLDDALLELVSVTANDVALALTTRVMAYPTYRVPFDTLRLVSTADDWYSVNSPSDWPQIVKVTAYYGMHTDYSHAWYAADAVANAGGISAAATSLTVADADGTGRDGETPRFSAGNLIRIGSEFMRVIASGADLDTPTNILTIRRAENGTTAAAHALGATVSVWYPEQDIRHVVARQAALLYARRGAFEQQAILGDGVYTYPPDLLPELRNVVSSFNYATVR